jgi:hypothetical protein
MLRLVSTRPTDREVAAAAPPVLRRLRGSLKRGTLTDYRRHLERKYR